MDRRALLTLMAYNLGALEGVTNGLVVSVLGDIGKWSFDQRIAAMVMGQVVMVEVITLWFRHFVVEPYNDRSRKK